MTFHQRSLVELGEFLSRVSESVFSGAPFHQTLDLIRTQLRLAAVAVRLDDRSTSGSTSIFLSTTEPTPPAVFEAELCARLSGLLETNRHVSAVVTSEIDGSRLTFWMFRDRVGAGFNTDETSLCAVIAGQLRRGLELSERIGAGEVERVLYSKVLDRLSVGVLILDTTGRVIKCSSKAEETLAARDGLHLQLGKLRATCAKEDRKLQFAIKEAISAAARGEPPACCGLALTKSSGNRSLGLIVQPVTVAQRGTATSPMVAIYVRDPEANSDVESGLVRQLFDLSPAEAAVARRLAAGLSLEDAAHSLAISRNTARAHLRSIFSKSGISRQTELVRLMLNSAAVLGERPLQVA